jgi:hypothetical protein
MPAPAGRKAGFSGGQRGHIRATGPIRDARGGEREEQPCSPRRCLVAPEALVALSRFAKPQRDLQSQSPASIHGRSAAPPATPTGECRRFQPEPSSWVLASSRRLRWACRWTYLSRDDSTSMLPADRQEPRQLSESPARRARLSEVRPRGLEPPRTIKSTRPSTPYPRCRSVQGRLDRPNCGAG